MNSFESNKNYKKNNSGRKIRDTPENIQKIENEFKNLVINIPKDADEYDNYISMMKEYTQYLFKQNVTTSQIRKVYGEVMNSKSKMDLNKVRPKLAYIIGKNRGAKCERGITSLLEILDVGICNLKNEDNINDFKEFMETIVAYRKYAGKDD